MKDEQVRDSKALPGWGERVEAKTNFTETCHAGFPNRAHEV